LDAALAGAPLFAGAGRFAARVGGGITAAQSKQVGRMQASELSGPIAKTTGTSTLLDLAGRC
jgi:hypothetical protein